MFVEAAETAAAADEMQFVEAADKWAQPVAEALFLCIAELAAAAAFGNYYQISKETLLWVFAQLAFARLEFALLGIVSMELGISHIFADAHLAEAVA